MASSVPSGVGNGSDARARIAGVIGAKVNRESKSNAAERWSATWSAGSFARIDVRSIVRRLSTRTNSLDIARVMCAHELSGFGCPYNIRMSTDESTYAFTACVGPRATAQRDRMADP